REQKVISDALSSKEWQLRLLGVRALGRVGGQLTSRPQAPQAASRSAAQVSGANPPRPPSTAGSPVGTRPTLDRFLNDVDARVRAEAANALGDSGSAIVPEIGTPVPIPAMLAEASLKTQLDREPDDIVAGTILEAMGRLKYADDPARDGVE